MKKLPDWDEISYSGVLGIVITDLRSKFRNSKWRIQYGLLSYLLKSFVSTHYPRKRERIQIECATYESGFTCLAYWNSSEWVLPNANWNEYFFDGFVGSMANWWWRSHHVKVKICPVNPFGIIEIRGFMKKVVEGGTLARLNAFCRIHIYTFQSFSMHPWRTLLLIRNDEYNSWYVYHGIKNLIIECVCTDKKHVTSSIDRLGCEFRKWSRRLLFHLEKNDDISHFLLFTTFC